MNTGEVKHQRATIRPGSKVKCLGDIGQIVDVRFVYHAGFQEERTIVIIEWLDGGDSQHGLEEFFPTGRIEGL